VLFFPAGAGERLPDAVADTTRTESEKVPKSDDLSPFLLIWGGVSLLSPDGTHHETNVTG